MYCGFHEEGDKCPECHKGSWTGKEKARVVVILPHPVAVVLINYLPAENVGGKKIPRRTRILLQPLAWLCGNLNHDPWTKRKLIIGINLILHLP